MNILDEALKSGLHFYLMKIMRIFLNEKFMSQFVKEQPESKLAKEIKERSQTLDEELRAVFKVLTSLQSELKIEKFKDGFNLEVQDFSSIKEGYRNTVGKAYECIQKRVTEPNKRAQLKLRIFCCHLINRVFKMEWKRETFPYFMEWAKELKKGSKKNFDFGLFEKWIQAESTDRISSSIEAINKIFYKKD